ncbi:unnamed protein product [Vicia faba]|uniref:Uncharacterized protein n=1 Tax=Vicia faba TaxID=3906 RepID=A0AAV1BDY3_VICFA|nr:unnamed protein product [Vicia faba]
MKREINIDSNPTGIAAENVESDNTSSGAEELKGDQIGTETSIIKYDVPVSTDSRCVHLVSNKGSNKGSNSDVNPFGEVQQHVPTPNSPHPSKSSESDTESDKDRPTNMDIQDI